jgi:hypothetical protein
MAENYAPAAELPKHVAPTSQSLSAFPLLRLGIRGGRNGRRCEELTKTVGVGSAMRVLAVASKSTTARLQRWYRKT